MSKKFLIGVMIFLIIVVSMLLQINFLNETTLWGVSANIAIVMIVGIGLMSGTTPGILVGAAYGIFFDILSRKKHRSIYSECIYCFGYSSGIFSRGFSKENKFSLIYMTALYTAIIELLIYGMFIIIYGYEFEIIIIAKKIILEAAYNMILSRLLFKPIASVGEIINKSKQSYYML